jgi:hypothetical protein
MVSGHGRRGEPSGGDPLAGRLRDTLAAPGALFERLQGRPAWGEALLAVMAIGLLAMLLTPGHLFVDAARDAIRQAGDGAAAVPPESLARWARLSGAAGVVVGTAMVAFGAAGLLTLLFGGPDGRRASYRQHLAVAAHVLLIPVLGMLASLPLRIATGDPAARLTVAVLLPVFEPGTFALRLAVGVDVFALWAVVLAALGVSRVHPAVRWPRALATLLVLYLAILATAAWLAA